MFVATKSFVPPIQGINDEKQDGVRAVVIALDGDCSNSSSRKIAYLEMYSPELKKQFESFRNRDAEGTAPVQTLSVFTLLIASEDMDEQTAYGIIETLYKNKRTLQTAHPSMLAVDEDVIRKGIAGIEMHPGAVRFFKEN